MKWLVDELELDHVKLDKVRIRQSVIRPANKQTCQPLEFKNCIFYFKKLYFIDKNCIFRVSENNVREVLSAGV